MFFFSFLFKSRIQKTIEERILMKMFVKLIPSSLDKCGSNFSNDTMVCATIDEKSNISASSDFCQVRDIID